MPLLVLDFCGMCRLAAQASLQKLTLRPGRDTLGKYAKSVFSIPYPSTSGNMPPISWAMSMDSANSISVDDTTLAAALTALHRKNCLAPVRNSL